MADSNSIVDIARECLGTPFYHQGRQLGVGMDCAGVVVHVLKRLELPVLDTTGYPRTPYDGMLKKQLDSEPSLEEIGDYEPGCVLLMRVTNDPQHLALWTGDRIIHGSVELGKVVEQTMPPKSKARVVGFYRIVS